MLHYAAFHLGLHCLSKYSFGGVNSIQKVKSSVSYVRNGRMVSSDFCGLLITYANSLDPDQDRHNVGPDLDPNHLTL